MLQANPELVRLLLLGVLVLSVALVVLVGVFKIRRDLAERTSGSVRQSLLTAWQAGDHARSVALAARAVRSSTQRQIDLLVACQIAAGAPWASSDVCDRVRLAGVEAGVPQVLRRQLASRQSARRGLAVVLGGYPVGELEPADLVPFTADANSTVRLAAAASLERLASAEAARALISALIDGTMPSPRLIERLGHAWAVPELLDALASSSDERVRCDLLRALALAGDPRASDAAIEISGSGSAEERIQAMRVIASVCRDPDASVRQVAVRAALAGVDDPQANVRAQAIAILMRSPDGGEVEVIERLAHDPDWFVRRAAAQALGVLGPSGHAALERLSHGDDRFAAERAREELALLHAREAAQRAVSP